MPKKGKKLLWGTAVHAHCGYTLLNVIFLSSLVKFLLFSLSLISYSLLGSESAEDFIEKKFNKFICQWSIANMIVTFLCLNSKIKLRLFCFWKEN